MILDELKVRLGIDADTFTVREFGHAMGEIPFSAAAAVASLAGMSVGFVALTKNVLDMNSGLQVFTASTGENNRALQQWQLAAKSVGLTGNEVTSAFTQISNILGSFGTSHPNTAALSILSQLGVTDMSGSLDDVMSRLQTGALNMDPKRATNLLNQLGLNGADLMSVFSVSASERRAMQPTMSSADQEAMREFQKELAFFNRTAMREFVKVLTEFEPYMGAFTEVMAVAIAKIGGISGYAIGETSKLIQAMIHQGGLSKFVENLSYQMMSPSETRGGKYQQFVADTTINVHGNLDEQVVAEIAGHHVTRGMTRAMKQFNNQGY